ncbi:MAG: prephenate dehydratase [Steroidobacteraceae bacterium]
MIRVAFQGERGAFSEEAAARLLGSAAEMVPCQRFEDVYQSLRDGRVDSAVIPIENTLHGSVHENYDHWLNFQFRIVGETSLRIVHNLMTMPGVTLDQVRRVYSHPVALNQCLDFFVEHPGIEKVPHYDTAGSVKTVMEKGLRDAGAIASAVAADIYGAQILLRSIEDDRANFTRFFHLRRTEDAGPPAAPPDAVWKTSLVFTTRNQPAALFRALSAFALRDLDLSKIESRPLRGKPWEYLFYLDFLAPLDSVPAQHALKHLAEYADFLRVLGCYPQGS